MIIGKINTESLKLHPELVHNAELWACNFQYSDTRDGKLRLRSLPTLGKIMHSQYKNSNDSYTGTDVKYFIPYKKNSTELAYSKAVLIYSRLFATTELECKSLYNQEVQKYINFYE